MKQVEVTILGQGYVLGCPEGGEARLQSAVASVDQEMTAIRDGGKVRARERIAVLAALNLAYQLHAPTAGPGPADNRAADAGHSGDSGTGDAAALSGDGSIASSAAGSPDVDALVRRLDAALGSDGHLI